MDFKAIAQTWLSQSQVALTTDAEATLLTQILEAEKVLAPALGRLAGEPDCPPRIRCAALDQYVRYEQGNAEMLLRELIRSQEEDVRAAAFQWLIDVGQPADPLRGATRNQDWLRQLRQDPSPRVRWLASLAAVNEAEV